MTDFLSPATLFDATVATTTDIERFVAADDDNDHPDARALSVCIFPATAFECFRMRMTSPITLMPMSWRYS